MNAGATFPSFRCSPGKTRLINHFRINDSWYLVDLPGYGYARTSKTQRDEFAKIITDYVLRCERMHFLFVLVDSRLEPQKIDLRFIEMLGREGIPFGIVFTKTDKLSAAQLARSVERYKQVLGEHPIPQEKGGLTTPTVVAGDKNRYIITDSFNRKRGEVLVRRGFGGDSASVKRHNGLEVGTATGEARGRGHAPQLVPG